MDRFVLAIVVALCMLATIDAGFPDLFGKFKQSRELKSLVKKVTQADGSEDKDFWVYASKSSINKCNVDFARTLRTNLYNNDGRNNADKLELYRLINQKTMQDCCKSYAGMADTWNDIQSSVPGLIPFAEGFSPDAADDADVVVRIAHVVRDMDQIISERGAFEHLYNAASPCAKFYRIIHDDQFDHVDYLQFLRLAAMPEYYPLTTEDHLNNVRVLALCDHIHNTGGLLEHAYAAYDNGN